MQKLMQAFRSLVAFFLPGGIIFFLAAALGRSDLKSGWLTIMGTALIYGILVIGLFLGWRFHRSRLAAAIFLVVLVERLLFYFGGSAGNASLAGGLPVKMLIGALLPLNLLFLSFNTEYRLHRLPSLLVFALIILQAPFSVLLIKHWHQLTGLLTYNLVEAWRVPSSTVHQPVLLLQAVVALYFLAQALVDQKPVSWGFFWLLLTSLYGLQFAETAVGRTFCFVAAGLILILTLLESVYAMAFRDELTGLPGRRAMNSAFFGLSGDYTVAMVDIDFFKKFNNRFGHDVGDEVLRMVAAKLDRVEGDGRAFRYGGEEFILLFAGKKKVEVLPYLERLRQIVSEAGFVLRRKNRPRRKPRRKSGNRRPVVQTVSVTISIGVADSAIGGKGSSIIKAADQALYSAKKNGRNRVE